MDEELLVDDRDAEISEHHWRALTCTRCGHRTRPHVLWFDEYYDEELYRAESSLGAGNHADVVVTVGTSGATNLPHQVVRAAMQRGATLIDINPEENPFSEIATTSANGKWIRGAADQELPKILTMLQSL